MNHGRPLGIRKTIRLMIALTILAWATQTLLAQWGYGAEVSLHEPAEEKFVPGTAKFAAGATLELRGEATVLGSDVTLKQVCRWADSEASVFTPISDLVITRLDVKTPFRAISVDDLKTFLHDAGVNLAVIKFAGATSCTVNRGDVHLDERIALEQWIAARQGKSLEVSTAAVAAASQPTAKADDPGNGAPAEATVGTMPSLRQLLITDLATRLGLPADQVQIQFNQRDEKILNLSQPLFRFNIEARRAHNLGPVAWNVVIDTDGSSQKVVVAGNARAWQNELVMMKPVSHGQLIPNDAVIERRTLTERLNDDLLLTRSQAVGQLAAMELKPGTVMTGRMVSASPLVKGGQLVTVTVNQGSVQITTVARAMETGSLGQTVRVKSTTTGSVYEVTMTGPQTATLGQGAASLISADLTPTAGAIEGSRP